LKALPREDILQPAASLLGAQMFRLMTVLIAGLLALAGTTPDEVPDAGSQSAEVRGYPMPGLPNIGIELGLNTAGNVESVLVYEGQKRVQTLNVCTEEPVKREKQVGSLATADYNFDGYSDLALQVKTDKNNNMYCIWLFDPQEHRFTASSELDQLVNPIPDPKTQTVVSQKYMACAYCYEKQVFRWSGGQLELVKSESLVMDSLAVGMGGCNYVLTRKELKGGEMKQTDRERTNALGAPCPGQL
jgi:hypothetical protein